ncbi:MAG: MarR family transcriptional regulator [Ktedonobacteraceae bacterium]|nr:MarR family transcriptional regulator [Ktedonobacteraceae bacterium]
MADTSSPGELLGRELSTAVVLFHQAVAERMGLNATDFKCLDMLAQRGPLTAGRLAEILGLTGGAITGVIDRLEAAGFVQRERDPGDRRRVIIKPCDSQAYAKTLVPIFASLQQAMGEELANRYSPEEFDAIEDFLRRTIHILRQETLKLHQQAEGHSEPRAE